MHFTISKAGLILGILWVLMGCSGTSSPSSTPIPSSPTTSPTPSAILWLKQLGASNSTTTGYGISVAASGNIYVTGYTTGGLNGNTQIGNEDYYVAKYDSSGNLTWLKQVGVSSKSSRGYGITVDSSENLYIAGYTSGALPGNSQTGANDYFVAKYDSSGNRTWIKQFGVSSQNSFAVAVAVDSSGNSYLTGFTTGGLGGNVQTGTDDYFIAKHDTLGNLTWLQQLGVSAKVSKGTWVTVDSSLNSYVTGYTTGGLNGNTQIGQEDYFVAKYDSTGSLTWLKQLGVSSKQSEAYGVVLDGLGNVSVTGYTEGGLNGNTLNGTDDYFLAKYSSSGILAWVKQWGAASQGSFGRGVSLDTSGNYFVTGYTSGGLNGNSQTGNSDYFIAKLDPSGSLTWLKQLGVASNDSNGYGVALDSSGNPYITGLTDGGLGGNTEIGNFDCFVAKYRSSGGS